MRTTAIFLAILFSFLSAGCSDSGPPVHIIVPDDFKGEVVLKTDNSAAPMKKTGGHYEIHIPSSGVAIFKDLAPKEHWHVSVPKRASGAVIPWPGHVDADTPSWNGGSTNSEGVTRFYVGTLKEYYRHEGWDEKSAELERSSPSAP